MPLFALPRCSVLCFGKDWLMPSNLFRRLAAVVVPCLLIVGSAGIAAGEIYSTMRNVNAVPEAHGFRLNPAFDATVPQQPSDLSPPQAFEILRPSDKPVTIGRLFTSCSCIQLEANKRTFRPGERAVLQLHNIRPTPPAGQVYALFVQITSPIRATLRFDTFVQTGAPGPGAPNGSFAGAGNDHNPGQHSGQDNPGMIDVNDPGASALLYNQNLNQPNLSQTGSVAPNLNPYGQNLPGTQIAVAPVAAQVADRGVRTEHKEPKISAVKIIEEDPIVPVAPAAAQPVLPVAPLTVAIEPEKVVTQPQTPPAPPAPPAAPLPTAPLTALPTALPTAPVAVAPLGKPLTPPVRPLPTAETEVAAKTAERNRILPPTAPIAPVNLADNSADEEEEEGEEGMDSESREDSFLTDLDVDAAAAPANNFPPVVVNTPAPIGVGIVPVQTGLPALPGVSMPVPGRVAVAVPAPPAPSLPPLPPVAPLVIETPVPTAPAAGVVAQGTRRTAVIPAPTTAVTVATLPPVAGNVGAPAPIAQPTLTAIPAATAETGRISQAEINAGQAPLGLPPTIVAGPGAVLQSGPQIPLAARNVPAAGQPTAAAPITGVELSPEEYERMMVQARYDNTLDKDILTQFENVPPPIDPLAGKTEVQEPAAKLEGTADLAIDFGDSLDDLPAAQTRPRIAVPVPAAPAVRVQPQVAAPAARAERSAGQSQTSPIILPHADIIPSAAGEAAAEAAAAVGAVQAGTRNGEVVDGGVRGMVRGNWESPEQAQAHGIKVSEIDLPPEPAARQPQYPAIMTTPLTAPATGAGVVTVPIPVQIQATPPAAPAPQVQRPVLVQPVPAVVQQPVLVQPRQVMPQSPAPLTLREIEPAPIAPATVGSLPPAQTVTRSTRTVIPRDGVPIPRPVERNPNARKPVQAVSLITVGVRDLPAAIRFYEALGWTRTAAGKYDQTAFFQLQGQVLALYPMHDLLREQNMQNAMPEPGGITLALHVQDKADVWSVYQRFMDAGGTSLRVPSEMPSGAVSCYVADPDGNPWEISWVPQFHIDEDGGLWLP